MSRANDLRVGDLVYHNDEPMGEGRIIALFKAKDEYLVRWNLRQREGLAVIVRKHSRWALKRI